MRTVKIRGSVGGARVWSYHGEGKGVVILEEGHMERKF